MNSCDRRTFLKTAGIAALGSAWPLAAARSVFADGDKKPNVLFVFTDQHRAASTGCYGDAQIKTPNLDQFSGQGARLDACIATTPVCCPFRACLMTGLLGRENGVVTNEAPLDPQRQSATIGKAFKKAGYACGYIGKWHLGPTEIAPGPARFGFDDYWAVSVAPHNYTNMNFADGPGKPVHGAGTYAPSMETGQAMQFIETNKDKPWLLMLSWGPPHPPYIPPAEFDRHAGLTIGANVPAGKAAKYAAANIGKYYGLIESLDVEFGRLMAKLNALGLADNTIVVYTSDHGDMLGSQGLMYKRWPYDESTRVPFMVCWPGKIAAKSVVSMPFGTQDIFPTLATLAGIPAPTGIHGSDFSGLLLGQPKARTQEHAFMTMQHGYVPWPGWRGMRTEQYLYARTEAEPWLLFDLKSDPLQQQNLVQSKPELLKELDALTLDSMKKTGETWRDGPKDTGDSDRFHGGGEKEADQSLGGRWPKK